MFSVWTIHYHYYYYYMADNNVMSFKLHETFYNKNSFSENDKKLPSLIDAPQPEAPKYYSNDFPSVFILSTFAH